MEKSQEPQQQPREVSVEVVVENNNMILVGPFHSVFEFHGLTLRKDLALFRGNRRRMILGFRCFMVLLNATSIVVAGVILILHFTYNSQDIEALCMWLALHAMVLTSAVIYIQTLFRLATVRNYIRALDELIISLTQLDAPKRQQCFNDMHNMVNRCLLLNYSSQLVEVIMLVLHMSFGSHKKIFYDDLASVYDLKDSRKHYFVYVMLSVWWGVLGHSYIRLYNSLVAVVCVTLHKCLQLLVEGKSGMSFQMYISKHEHIGILIREADLLFSPFFFVKLARTFVIVVVFSRFLKSLEGLWDNLFIVYTVASSLVSLWYNTSLASRLNEKYLKRVIDSTSKKKR